MFLCTLVSLNSRATVKSNCKMPQKLRSVIGQTLESDLQVLSQCQRESELHSLYAYLPQKFHIMQRFFYRHIQSGPKKVITLF